MTTNEYTPMAKDENEAASWSAKDGTYARNDEPDDISVFAIEDR